LTERQSEAVARELEKPPSLSDDGQILSWGVPAKTMAIGVKVRTLISWRNNPLYRSEVLRRLRAREPADM
jgi:hypothetical protein